jgi:predicted Fe-S protein YdhL (DUF1289 family)
MTEPYPSPCIGVCELAPGEAFCAGCRRTLSEIARWPGMTDAEKSRVLTDIKSRQAKPDTREKP